MTFPNRLCKVLELLGADEQLPFDADFLRLLHNADSPPIEALLEQSRRFPQPREPHDEGARALATLEISWSKFLHLSSRLWRAQQLLEANP